MSQENNKIETEGIVTNVLRDTNFKVKINNTEHSIDATISGKMRKNKIRINTGDTVTVEIDKTDISKGRIIFRKK